jgi:hypothetical protein
VKHWGVRLAVCLLALCAVVLETSSHINRKRHAVAGDRLQRVDRTGGVARIDAGFLLDAGRHQPKRAWDKRPDADAWAKHDLAPVFFREPQTWFADNAHWTSPGNKMWQDFYIGSPTSNMATIGGMEGNLGIDGNSGIMPPIDWQGTNLPFSGSNFSQSQFGGSYGAVLPANASNAAYLTPRANASASNGASLAANLPPTMNAAMASEATATNLSSAENLSASTATDGNLELVRLGTRMEAAQTDGESGLLSTAAMDMVTDVYQAAGGMLLAYSGPGKFNSGETGSQGVKNRIVARTGGISSAVWSNSNGQTTQGIADSTTVNQGLAPKQGQTPGAGSSVVADDETWGAQSQNSIPSQNIPVDNPARGSAPDAVPQSGLAPAPQSTPNPVPEPSQILLMVTVIVLAALGAKRSAVKRHVAARPGGWAS